MDKILISYIKYNVFYWFPDVSYFIAFIGHITIFFEYPDLLKFTYIYMYYFDFQIAKNEIPVNF